MKNEFQIHISGSLSISALHFQIQKTTFVCLQVHSAATSNLLFNPSSSGFFISVIVLWNSRILIRCLNLFIFNWRIIALHYCVGFCQHESAIGIVRMLPPSWTSLPPPSPSHPSRLSRSTGLNSLCHRANLHWLSNVTCGNVYVSVLLTALIPPSPPCPVPTSLVSVCRLHRCPADMFISTIFLDFIYMH